MSRNKTLNRQLSPAPAKPREPIKTADVPPIGLPSVSPASSPPWSVTTKAIVAVVSLVLIALVIWRFQSLLPPLVIAFILAYLLTPVINLVAKRLRLNHGITVLLVYVSLALILLGGAFALGIVVVDQVQRLSRELPRLILRATGLIHLLSDAVPMHFISIGPFTFDPTVQLNSLNLAEQLGREAVGWIQPLISQSSSLVGQLARVTLDILGLSFLIFVVSIYIARDLAGFGGFIRDLAQQPGYRQDAERLMYDFGQIWNSYLRGQVILGLIMGILTGLVLAVLGVNNALALGLLWGSLEFLPIIGPIVSAVASVLVAFFQDGNYLGMSSFHFALLILVTVTILQQMEHNLLVPRVVGEALDLHPLIVLFSVLMGASLAGVLGAVLAAPMVASLKLFGSYAWRKMLDLPPFPEPPVPAVNQLPTKRFGWWKNVQGWTARPSASSKHK